ncbi:MAG: MBL fold metallo-hydrolase [Rhodoglobus sp.]
MIRRELAEKIFHLTVPMSAELSTSIVVLDDESGSVLVDAGTAAGGFAVIAAGVVDGSWTAPSAVLCTHFHHDHTGGLAEMKKAWGVSVFAHVAEVELIQRPAGFAEALRLNGFAVAPPSAQGVTASGVLDGFITSVGSRRWEAIHVPGHSWGHLAFFSAADRILITGDAIQGAGVPFKGVPGQGTGLPYYLDVDCYRRSLRRLRDLRPTTVVRSHELPGFVEPVLTDSAEIERIFDESLQAVADLDAVVAEEAAASGSLAEIAERVCHRMLLPEPTPQAVLTIRAHLVDQGAALP